MGPDIMDILRFKFQRRQLRNQIRQLPFANSVHKAMSKNLDWGGGGKYLKSELPDGKFTNQKSFIM
jgi:hypothetical protein